jgi:branched-chain amino acid transport system permease protein
MSSKRVRMAAWGVVLVLAVLLPFFFNSYRVGQFTQAAALAIAVLGLNLLVGYSGQISLGHGAFFALGAYASAISINDLGVPYLLTLPIAGAICALAGFLLGLPALRLRGLYLALVTLGVAIATPQVIKRADGLTGGTQGLSVEKVTAPAWSGLADDQWLYFLTLVVATVMFVLAAFLVRGRVGRALVAIRENEIAARTMGVDLARFKTGTFAVSAMYAGVGGALFTLPIGFLAPESFPLALSFAFLAAIVVGGLATIAGALFGALFIEFVPVYAADVDEALAGVIYGGVLILFMYLLPGGVMGLVRRISSTKAKPRRSDDAETGTGDRPGGRAAGAGAGAARERVRAR